MELKAKKYGLDIPDHVVVELVYSTDKFKPYKKDRNNQIESYDFEITDVFNRGQVVGGFYYHIFTEAPEKNKLVVMTYADILKRKPQYASVEFWGGEKDVWENNKKVGKETVEGWHDKMCWKTVYRAAYRDITIDSQKIDDDYLKLKQTEAEFRAAEPEREIAENANMTTIDVTGEVVTDPPAGAPGGNSMPDPAQKPPDSKTAGGPGF
jgi:recombination protein RecT